MSGALIDAHVHLWNRSRTPQDWIDPHSMQAIDRDFWMEDLDEVLMSNGATGAIIVQASNSRQETGDLLTAELPDSVVAIVGWVDLTAPDVREDIAEAISASNGHLLAGIRHLVHIDLDPHWLTRPAVSNGLEELEAAGLSFDLVITPGHLNDALRVVGEHPGLVFILDHLGKPPLRSNELAAWESGLRALAAFPNVYAKVSGLTMEADWKRWAVGDLQYAITAALDSFGPDRLMFGSDWPLVELCGGYGGWLRAARELVSGLGSADRDAVFSGTARTAYRLRELPRA